MEDLRHDETLAQSEFFYPWFCLIFAGAFIGKIWVREVDERFCKSILEDEMDEVLFMFPSFSLDYCIFLGLNCVR